MCPGRRTLALVWLFGSLALLALVAIARLGLTGGDDPDTARQRPGILDLGELPSPAPTIYGARSGEAVTIFFAGRDKGPALCDRIEREPETVAPAQVVVISRDPLPNCPSRVSVTVADPTAQAERFGMPRPIDGGETVGYAIVDSSGQLRYRTLDPEIAQQTGEVATMLNGLS